MKVKAKWHTIHHLDTVICILNELWHTTHFFDTVICILAVTHSTHLGNNQIGAREMIQFLERH